MRNFFTNVIFFSLLAVMMGSVFGLFAPKLVLFPVPMFSVAVALTLSRGFFASFPWAVFFGVVGDIAAFGRIGMLSATCVGIVYTVSFFSRRFTVEHKAATGIFSSLLIGMVSFFYPFMSGFLLEGRIGVDALPPLRIATGIFIASFVMFFVSRVLLEWFDRWSARFASETFS